MSEQRFLNEVIFEAGLSNLSDPGVSKSDKQDSRREILGFLGKYPELKLKSTHGEYEIHGIVDYKILADGIFYAIANGLDLDAKYINDQFENLNINLRAVEYSSKMEILAISASCK